MSRLSIKEAGRYSNFLSTAIDKFIMLVYGGIDSKLIKVTEHHRKSKASDKVEDEILEIEFNDDIDVELEILDRILKDLIKEKVLLNNKINKAKKEISIKTETIGEIGLDAAIEYSKSLRMVANNFYESLVKKTGGKSVKRGEGFTFNVEGNQTPYYYDIEVETEIIYNQNEYIKKRKGTLMLADKISSKIEAAMTSDIVEFSPRFNYLDRLEDIVDRYIN